MRSTKKLILTASAAACLCVVSAAQAQTVSGSGSGSGGWSPSCSARTLKGAYGVKLVGSVTTPAGSAKLDAVSHMTFSGSAALPTFTSTTVGRVGGNSVPNIPYDGTYTVSANCTGTLSFATAIGGVLDKVAFVIVDGGDELFMVVDSSLAQVSGEAERIAGRRGRHDD